MAELTTPSGVTMAYETVGVGDPLLLIHGLTESRRAWDPLVPTLAADHTVVLLDLPGHGESGAGTAYDPQSLAGDVAAVIGALDLGTPLVVGHSFGGVVATAYGALHPARGVVNVDQPLDLVGFQELVRSIEPSLRGDVATFTATMDMVMTTLAGPLSDAERGRLDDLRRADQDVVLAIWGPVLEQPPEVLDALVREVGSRVAVPYLSLHGDDPGEGYAAWLAELIPGAITELWPGLGHYPHLVEPDRFLARLNDFERSLT